MTASVPLTRSEEGDDCGCSSIDVLSQEPAAGIHGLDPAVRLLACMTFALAVVSLESVSLLSIAFLLAGGMALAARLKLWPTLRRMVAVDGFMVVVLAMLPFSVPGTALFSLAGFPASREGGLQALQILLCSNAVVLMILALLGSMEPSRLGQAMSRLGAPDKFVHLFLFTLRYIEVLGREYRRLRLAMKARGFRLRCNLHSWRSIGYLFGMLLVHSIERSERILAAMRCRGFTGQFPSLSEPSPLCRRDQAFAGFSVAGSLALAVLGRL